MNKLLKIFILTGLVLLSFEVKPQQIFQFSQHMFRPALYNPAAISNDDYLCVFAAGRSQWMGFNDENNENVNPTNYLLGASMPLYSINSGVGLTLGREKIGYQTALNVRLDYSYKMEIDDKQFISGGVLLQLSQLSFDVSKLKPAFPYDPLLSETGKQRDFVPDAGIGFMYSNKDKWWAGISYLNMLGSTATLGNFEIRNKPAFIAQGSYKVNVIKQRFRKIDVAPALLVKTNLTETQTEISVSGYLNDALWLGAGYRLQDAVVLLGGIQVNSMKLGISYDFTTNQIRKATRAGSVEVHLSYCIPGSSNDSQNSNTAERPTTKNSFWNKVTERHPPHKMKMRSMFNTRHL